MENSLPPSSPGNSWLKYVFLEVGIVVVLLSVVGFFIFKPFEKISIPKSSKPPLAMAKSVSPDGQTVAITPPKAAPVVVVITIDEIEAVPPVVEGKASGTIIRINNNSIMPIVVKFSNNLYSDVKIGPNVAWESPNLFKKGSYAYSVEGSNMGGRIEIK